MNLTVSIILIVAFFLIGEILTWVTRKSTTFAFVYVTAIRVLTVCLALMTIQCIRVDYNDVQFLEEANEYKIELLDHQYMLIEYQRNMIDEMGNHLWHEHDCDLPMFDGDLLDDIHQEEHILDSLYNTQL